MKKMAWSGAGIGALALMVAGCMGDGSTSKVGARTSALTADQCSYFASSAGTDTVCHATKSTKNPYVLLKIDVTGCDDHAANHPNDFIDTASPPSCNSEGCLPEGAPYDPTNTLQPCCDNLVGTSGTCECATGLTFCLDAASCVDLTSDVNNCGACGNACATGDSCCNGTCVNEQTDLANCGACGNACATTANSSPTCAAGACGIACNSGFANCNGVAADGCEVNTQVDPNNCGGCGTACPSGGSCSAGSCGCPSGTVNCTTACTPTGTLAFSRLTDSVQIAGSSPTIAGTSTWEFEVYFATDHTDGDLYHSQTDGVEDKTMDVGPDYVGFGFYPSNYLSLSQTGLFSLGTWHHVAYVLDTSAALQQRIYIDGVMVASSATSGWVQNGTGAPEFLGYEEGRFYSGDTENSFIGTLGTLRISNVARYSGTSTTTANFTVPTGDLATDANTQLLYNFDDSPCNDNDTIADLSGNGHTGTFGAGSANGSATEPTLQ